MATDAAGTPVPCRINWADDSFTVETLEGHAARIMAMVQSAQGGSLCLPTGWLFPKWSKYSLELEILRASLYRYRIGCIFWESAGLPVPNQAYEKSKSLSKSFIEVWRDFRCSQNEGNPRFDENRLGLLHQIVEASDELTSTLVQHQGFAGLRATESAERSRIAKIHQKRTEAPFRFGLLVDPNDLFPQTSSQPNGEEIAANGISDDETISSLQNRKNLKNAIHNFPATIVSVKAPWKRHADLPAEEMVTDSQSDTHDHLELQSGVLSYNPNQREILNSSLSSLNTENRNVAIGPMIRFGSGCLPPDISPNSDGIEVGMKFGDYVSNQLQSQKNLFQVAYVASGINGVGAGGITPTAQMNIVTEGLEAASAICPNVPLMVSFNQPLGERLAWSVGAQSPAQILSKLSNQRIPLHLIGLEFDIGFFPSGTLPRDMLSWVMNLQRWSVWNIPLMIILRVPSAKAKKNRQIHFDAVGAGHRSPENQFQSIAKLTELFSSLPWVHGLMLADWKDEDEFPSGGMCYDNLRPKPWLAPFTVTF